MQSKSEGGEGDESMYIQTNGPSSLGVNLNNTFTSHSLFVPGLNSLGVFEVF